MIYLIPVQVYFINFKYLYLFIIKICVNYNKPAVVFLS